MTTARLVSVLNENFDEPLSNAAFKFDLRRYMKPLRRRDDFLKLLAQNRKLQYPDRRLYAELDNQAKHAMDAAAVGPGRYCPPRHRHAF